MPQLNLRKDVNAPSIMSQLVSKHLAQWVDQDCLDAWLEQQQGDAVLLLAGDPIRFPESLDVAVVLPELQRATVSNGKSFEIAVAVPESADAIATKFGSQRWPALIFFRDGQYVTTLSGMHDWVDYVDLVKQALSLPISRPPSIGIRLVGNDAGTGCH